MIKNLSVHGNSAALIIDKPILELLDITFETPLKITTDGVSLIITPVRDRGREKKFREALAKVNNDHAATLKRLAK